MPLFRRSANPDGVVPRRPHAGLLRRERRALLQAPEAELRELGGLLVEMYRRGSFRDDLLSERAAAVVATCPRCGTARAASDRYCLACGLKLPVVAGTVPALRRRWLRRLGWYPGDWVWLSLASLVVAVGAAAAAIAVTTRNDKPKPVVFTAPGQVAVGEPSSGIAVRPRSTVPARKLPKAPEPAVLPKRVRWP